MKDIRTLRQIKLNKKIQRLREHADRLKKLAEQKQSRFNSYRGDIAFMTQPASKGSSFGRFRDRVFESYQQGLQLYNEAQELCEKADWLEQRGVAVKGDAERNRQEKRQQQDTVIVVGSKVVDFCYGAGEILKVNKKTYTIRFTPDFTCARDKTFVKLV